VHLGRAEEWTSWLVERGWKGWRGKGDIAKDIGGSGIIEGGRKGRVNVGKGVGSLGHPWLRKHNPEINLQTGEVKNVPCPRNECVDHCSNVRKGRRRKLAEKWKYKATV